MYSSDMGHVSRKASRDNNFCGMLVNILFFFQKVGLYGHLLELRGCPFRTLFVSFFTHPKLTFTHRPMSTLWCTWHRMTRPCTGSRHPYMFCSSPPSLPRTMCQCVLIVMVHSHLHSCTAQLGHINVAEESIQDADSRYSYFPQHIPSVALECN